MNAEAPVEANDAYRINGEWIEQQVDGRWVARAKVAAAVRLTEEAVDSVSDEVRRASST